jgi:NAD(P)-dependent dehydrogenase (short-subunit alcohol dehydrogenase family)
MCALGSEAAAVDSEVSAVASEASAAAKDAAAADTAGEEAVRALLAETGSLDLLVVDGAGLFAHGARGRADGDEGEARVALGACLRLAWCVTRAVVNVAFLPADRGGRIVYLAPAPDAGEHADGARAGLENLSRTLSIEWARHRITAVTVAPGARTSAGEVAALTAYLASPAGAYFSGCLLDLRGPAG